MFVRRQCVCPEKLDRKRGQRAAVDENATTNRKTSLRCHSCWPNDNIFSRNFPLPHGREAFSFSANFVGIQYWSNTYEKKSPIGKREKANGVTRNIKFCCCLEYLEKFLYICQNICSFFQDGGGGQLAVKEWRINSSYYYCFLIRNANIIVIPLWVLCQKSFI